jgi:hypothetical protein
MRQIILIAGLLTMATVPHNSWAWGKKGHNIVAEVAYDRLDKGTRDRVTQYLGTTSFEDASTWMDEVRSDHAYDYMKPWHYVNIPQGQNYVANTEENVVNEIDKVIAELQHKEKLSPEDIKKDIMILFHLVGDLHQPLHVGYKSDKGGNDIKVTYKGKPANLHWVWDNEIIESENITVKDCLNYGNKLPKAAIADYQKVNVSNWVAGIRPLLTNVYNYQGATIGDTYAQQNVSLIEQQLFMGGVRLAAVLELCFKS